jgi:hypothetical protein
MLWVFVAWDDHRRQRMSEKPVTAAELRARQARIRERSFVQQTEDEQKAALNEASRKVLKLRADWQVAVQDAAERFPSATFLVVVRVGDKMPYLKALSQLAPEVRQYGFVLALIEERCLFVENGYEPGVVLRTQVRGGHRRGYRVPDPTDIGNAERMLWVAICWEEE